LDTALCAYILHVLFASSFLLLCVPVWECWMLLRVRTSYMCFLRRPFCFDCLTHTAHCASRHQPLWTTIRWPWPTQWTRPRRSHDAFHCTTTTSLQWPRRLRVSSTRGTSLITREYFFDRVASGREGVWHTSTKTRSRTRGARLLDRARMTVVKPDRVTDNYFHQGSACFESCGHHRTRLIVAFLAFITGHVPDLASHVLGDFERASWRGWRRPLRGARSRLVTAL
jgi:hypothetical protein